MLTTSHMRKRISEITYLPGYKMEVYQGRFEGPHFHLQVEVDDYINKGQKTVLDVHSPIPFCKDVEAFDNWLVDRLIRLASHEVREALQFNGKPIFDPHIDDKDL